MIWRGLREVGGGFELDLLMFSSSSRLWTWLVGVGQIVHPNNLQGVKIIYLLIFLG